MLDFLFADGGSWFAAPALLGTGYFVISMILDQAGGDVDIDAGGDGGPDAVGSGGHGQHDVRILSLQSISAFLMGAGWMGFAALRSTDMGFGGASLVGLVSGVGVAWLFTMLLRRLFQIQNSGNVALGDAVHKTGTVTVTIPPGGHGRGRVAIIVNGRRREFDATTQSDRELSMGSSAKIVGSDRASNSLAAEPLD